MTTASKKKMATTSKLTATTKKSSTEPPSVKLSSNPPNHYSLHLQPILVYLYPNTSLLLISRQICPSISNYCKSNKPYSSKKPTLPHPDYVDNCYWNYSDLDEGDDRKPSAVDSSPDSSAATSEASMGKLGLQAQLAAMRPKKKKKKKKKNVHNHHQITINHHYAPLLSPALADISNQKCCQQEGSVSLDTESPSPLPNPTKQHSNNNNNNKKHYKFQRYYYQ